MDKYWDKSKASEIYWLADSLFYEEAIEKLNDANLSQDDIQWIFNEHLSNLVYDHRIAGNWLHAYKKDLQSVAYVVNGRKGQPPQNKHNPKFGSSETKSFLQALVTLGASIDNCTDSSYDYLSMPSVGEVYAATKSEKHQTYSEVVALDFAEDNDWRVRHVLVSEGAILLSPCGVKYKTPYGERQVGKRYLPIGEGEDVEADITEELTL